MLAKVSATLTRIAVRLITLSIQRVDFSSSMTRLMKSALGGKCGSTSIDRAFIELLRRRFGNCFDNAPAKRKCMGSRFMEAFEGAKRDFGFVRPSRTYRFHLVMPVKDSEWYDEDENEVKLSR